MTIQDWGAIGEMVGGLAVIVTLGYLAFQLRQNATLTRAMIRQNVAESVRSMTHAGIDSDSFSSVMYRVMAGGDLTDEERSRFLRWLVGSFRVYENAYRQYETGLYTDEDWESTVSAMMIFFRSRNNKDNRAQVADFWRQNVANGVYRPGFVEEINRRRAEEGLLEEGEEI